MSIVQKHYLHKTSMGKISFYTPKEQMDPDNPTATIVVYGLGDDKFHSVTLPYDDAVTTANKIIAFMGARNMDELMTIPFNTYPRG